MKDLRGRRLAAVLAGVWVVLVVLALVSTLRSLATDDFDGLNNMLQIPFALPWILFPIGGLWAGEPWAHELDAWIAAGYGLVNAVLLYLYVLRVSPEPGRPQAGIGPQR